MTTDEMTFGTIEALAEHLCARRPCGDTPENVTDWLDYSLNKCGLVLITEQRLAELTRARTASSTREGL